MSVLAVGFIAVMLLLSMIVFISFSQVLATFLRVLAASPIFPPKWGSEKGRFQLFNLCFQANRGESACEDLRVPEDHLRRSRSKE